MIYEITYRVSDRQLQSPVTGKWIDCGTKAKVVKADSIEDAIAKSGVENIVSVSPESMYSWEYNERNLLRLVMLQFGSNYAFGKRDLDNHSEEHFYELKKDYIAWREASF